ncbi:MAG: alpha/beta hydrolase [Mitsuaria chitosanitabida]|uniref:alpha/beta hydrolase n=1 Tax=Roseateles chitosanitabidus TaxID=65048 RepID=UPI001B0CBC73|nr:alpha/beta hydrolase-fold protein [Roseateles chitosanitabidus]MBO9687562.1 alpha/beta hydrolase [Roseateles chitosanitabidus]
MIHRRHLLGAALAPLLTPSSPSFAAPALPEASGPYALPNTWVHPLPDPVSGRRYEVWIDLPPGASAPGTTTGNGTAATAAKARSALRPAVFVTDAPYAFPLVRALRNRVGQRGQNLADFVLVGLAGPADESAVDMRSRDYTPTDPLTKPNRPANRYGAPRYGGGDAYLKYIAEVVVPAVSERHRLDPDRRVILGHSYGALFASQVLFSRPALFSHYILGSPSLWFDEQEMFKREAAYAQRHQDLAAHVFQYIGAYEAVAPGPRFNKENDLVADALRFQAALRKRRYRSLRVDSHVLAGEDHLTVAPAGATLGLLWALPGRGPYEA